jgi:hypothetical protein
MHQVLVGDIAVSEHHCLDALVANQFFQVLLFKDWDPGGILQTACQFRRVAAARNIGDLGGGEGNNLVIGVVTKNDVEIMKVPARRT